MDPVKPDDDTSPLRAAALVSQLGIVVAVPIAAGTMLGVAVDDRMGETGLFVVVGILLGVAAGMVSAYRILKPYLD